MPDGSATAHLYRPKLITTLSEGYGLDRFRHDAMAALTVAIVALPLSMAIAVCQIAFKRDPCLECAPGAGRVEDLELTGSAGLSKDESHGPSPLS
jgi:hypothetical protein